MTNGLVFTGLYASTRQCIVTLYVWVHSALLMDQAPLWRAGCEPHTAMAAQPSTDWVPIPKTFTTCSCAKYWIHPGRLPEAHISAGDGSEWNDWIACGAGATEQAMLSVSHHHHHYTCSGGRNPARFICACSRKNNINLPPRGTPNGVDVNILAK